MSVQKRGNHKLSTKFDGPFDIIEKRNREAGLQIEVARGIKNTPCISRFSIEEKDWRREGTRINTARGKRINGNETSCNPRQKNGTKAQSTGTTNSN